MLKDSKSCLLITAVGLAAAIAAPNTAVGQDQFIAYLTNCTLDMQQIFDVVGDGGDPASIVNLSREQACAAGDQEQSVVKVRGDTALISMEEGKMSVDYADADNPTFTMYNPGNNTHATWTADELEELINQMMGGQGNAGGQGAMANALQQAQAAMSGGAEPAEVEGLYTVNSLADCEDEAFGAHQGEVGMDGGNPMAQNWLLRGCVTDEYPNALQAVRAIKEATDQLGGMDEEEKPIDEKEDELLEEGLPIDVRTLEQSGGLTAGLDYAVNFFTLEEAAVSESDVNAKEGMEVPLQQFMMAMMGGPSM